MGYCYGYNDKGNLVLACDGCGNVGGVRKRTCPVKVLCDSSRGPRSELSFCYPPALCSACYAKEKPTLHADCKADAAKVQAEYDANQARLDAGEPKVLAAWGSWHDDVPDGKVGVVFGGDGMPDVWYLIDADEYSPGVKRFLGDYATAVSFDGVDQRTKEVV